MTATTLRPPDGATGAGRALSRLTVRQLRRGAVLVAFTATGLTAVVAAQYQATFADALDSESLRALTENPAVRDLFGAARALNDPGGFTVWRTGTPVFVLCGVWALLAATRITRGEEDSGRWALLLAGRARLLDLVVRSAATLTLAAAAIASGVGVALTATGTDTTGALIHALCVFGARRRDLGGAVIRVSDSRAARTRLLGSVTGFSARRALTPTAGWAVGIAAYFLVIGAVLSSILEFLTDNPRFAELAATAGFGGLGSTTGFAAAMFALLAIPTGLYAATRIAAVVADEKARRHSMLHSRPLSRYQLAGAEILIATAGIAVLLVAAAAALWAGAVLTGASLGLGQALVGAFNIAPVALLALGAAVLALGWYPSAVGALGVLPVVGGFLLDVTTRSAGAPTWLIQISPFTHLAPVPDTTPDLSATLVLTAIAFAMTMTGLYGYARRDLDD